MINLKLVLKTQNTISPDLISISDREGNIDFKITNLHNPVIETKIKLPNIIYIKTLDYNISLKELWLGNIKATNSMLDQICCYTTDNLTKYTTHWPMPGSTKIEFFDSTFIEFHLHYSNNLKQYLYSSS